MLRLVAAGRTSHEIAAELFISTRTAEHHIANIYTKIAVSNRAAATRWAVTHRLVDDGRRRLSPARAGTYLRKWVDLPMPLTWAFADNDPAPAVRWERTRST